MKLFLVTTLAFCISCFQLRAIDESASPNAVSWEYRLMSYDELFKLAANEGSENPGATLNMRLAKRMGILGNDGWELCAYITESKTYVFKRIVQSVKEK